MSCPDCKIELHCPCSSCKERNDGKLRWINVRNKIEQIKCPTCGFIASMSFWEDWDVQQTKDAGEWPGSCSFKIKKEGRYKLGTMELRVRKGVFLEYQDEEL